MDKFCFLTCLQGENNEYTDSAIHDLDYIVEHSEKGYWQQQAVDDLARIYESIKEDYARALVCHTKAVELQPDNEFKYSFRGDCHMRLGNFESAIADYNKAISLESK